MYVCACVLSHLGHVLLFVPPRSMQFSRQEYWSGLLCFLPGDLPYPRTEPTSLMSPALAGGFFTTSATWEVWYIYIYAAATGAKSLQSCPTLCDPVDSSPPGSSVHEILQARILEWVAVSSSRGPSQPKDWTHISYVSCTGRWVVTMDRS